MHNTLMAGLCQKLASIISAFEIGGSYRRQPRVLLATIEENKGNAQRLQAHGEIIRQADRCQNDAVNLMRHQIFNDTIDLFQRIRREKDHHVIATGVQLIG